MQLTTKFLITILLIIIFVSIQSLKDPLSSVLINRKHIVLGVELGQGEFGSVLKAEYIKHEGLKRKVCVYFHCLTLALASLVIIVSTLHHNHIIIV